MFAVFGKKKTLFDLISFEYLRLLPLSSTGLADLKINPLDAFGAAHYLNAAQVRLEVVQDALGELQEGLQSGVVRHVLWQVGQQNCYIKADVLYAININ